MNAGDLVRFKPECAWAGRFTGVVVEPWGIWHIRIDWINSDGTLSHRTERVEQLEVISESRCQCTWDNQYGYNVAVNTTTLQA